MNGMQMHLNASGGGSGDRAGVLEKIAKEFMLVVMKTHDQGMRIFSLREISEGMQDSGHRF